MVQLIILAAVAVFLILRLRSLLGTRTGFEKPPKTIEERAEMSPRRETPFEVIEGGGVDRDIADYVPIDSDSGQALSSMKRAEPSFNVTEFLSGGRQAYEMIVMAYENGDLDTLGAFLAPDVLEGFEQAVNDRNAAGLVVEARFVGVREVKLKEATFDDATGIGELTIRFVGELTSVVRNAEGEVIEGSAEEIKRQADLWTFARVMGSDNPNWQLVATGA